MSTRASRANDADKHAKTLQELLRLPENKHCADCGDKGPRWASVNLGIFICMRCAGIHRQLGTHITKVKSTTLDSWIDEWVERMAEMGNEKANQVWEASNPSKKPTPQSNQPDLERYLRDKYERSLFKDSHHDRHSHSHDRHSHNEHRNNSHNEHRNNSHDHERRREPNRNTDFPAEDEFETRFDDSRQPAKQSSGGSSQFKIQIKTGGAPPLPARGAAAPATAPQRAPAPQPQPVQAAPKIDSLLDWSDPVPAPAPVQQPQPVAQNTQTNGAHQQDNFAAFSNAGFGDFGAQGDFSSLAAGKSTQDKKSDIMKMFESTPAPMMGGMGMGMNPGMGMGMGMNPAMGMGMNPGMGMGMGMNPAMNMGMNPAMGGMGMGMNPQMGGMGMNANMGGNMGGMGMRPGMGMPQGNPMQAQQHNAFAQQNTFGAQHNGYGAQQNPFGAQQNAYGAPHQNNGGMFGM